MGVGAAVPGQSGTDPLVERSAELARLGELLERVAAGVGSALVIEGEPGLGKTRLLAEAAELARRRGVRALQARAARSERDLPASVALRLVEPYLAGLVTSDRERVFGGAASLARPLLGGRAESDAASSPFAVLHGLYWLLVNIATDQPLLVCVDDLQWCDDTTTRLLLYLAERIEELPIMLLMAARPRRRGLESEPLRALRGASAVSTQRLTPLSPTAVAELLRGQCALVDGEFSAACSEVTGGNPFYLRQLVLALEDVGDGALPEPARVRDLGPTAVARSALFRLVRCSHACVRLAEALAVLDGPTPIQLAAALAELEPEEAARAADELAAEDLVVSGPALEFVHPLIRQSIYEEIPPAARAMAHAAAARLLRGAGRVEAVAAQLMLAPTSGNQQVVETLRGAAGEAVALGSPASAARMLHRALAEGSEQTPPPELLIEIAAAETQAGMPGAVEHARAALTGAVEPRERAAAYGVLARALAGENRPVDAVDALEAALGEVGGNDERTRTDLLADYLAYATFMPGLRQRAYARAEPLLHEPFDAESAEGRLVLAALAMRSGQTGAAREQTVELAERAWHDGALLDPGPDSSGWLMVVWALELAQAYEQSQKVCSAALAAATRTGSLQAFITASYFRGDDCHRRGQLVEAQADAEQAISARSDSAHRYVISAMVLRVLVLIERGHLEDARLSLDEADALPSVGMLEVPWRLHARGRLALAARRSDQALELFEQAGQYVSGELGADVTVLPWRTDAAFAALQVGDRDRARTHVETELEIADRAHLPISRGRALRLLGLITGGDEGLLLLTEATATLRDTSARLEWAGAAADLGAALRRSGRVREAREPLLDALRASEALDARLLAAAIGEEQAAAGIRPPRPTRTDPRLTPSQRRVAELAASGMSNSEIGQALFVTPKTVEYHLRQVYQRLQVPGRRQLAAALAAPGELRNASSSAHSSSQP